MEKRNKQYAILAPAGSKEALNSAVNNGADAVYLGLDKFNARMKAENFNAENLGGYVDYCHKFGVKVYVAINTSVKNNEFKEALQLVLTAYKSNADGVILTDTALISAASQLKGKFEIIASTQLNVHDGYGARLLKKLGAKTAVAARESRYCDISEIAQSGIGVECFIHGALCVSQSGQCLFSSIVGGNSGNRGLCAQPCRQKYKSFDKNGKLLKQGYLLSAKDLCGLDFAKKLYEAGARVFKIEGRNRRPEYSGGTAQVYSRLFENGFVCGKKDLTVLSELYNRGNFAKDVYLNGDNAGIIYPEAQGHIGVYAGKLHKDCLHSEIEIESGDGFKLFVGKAETGGAVAVGSGKGNIPLRLSGKVPNGADVCRTTSLKLLNAVSAAKRKIPAVAEFTASVGERAVLKLSDGNVSVTVYSAEIISKAEQKGTTRQEIEEQLRKTGNSNTIITDIVLNIDIVFINKAQLNAMRREAIDGFERCLTESYNKSLNRSSVEIEGFVGKICRTEGKPSLAVICKTKDEMLYASKRGAEYLIVKSEIISSETLDEFPLTKWFLDVPSFGDNSFIFSLLRKRAHIGVVANNIGTVGAARENGIAYIAGAGLNIFNDVMANSFSDAETFIYASELTLSEIKAFKRQDGLVFADGYLALMKLVHCPYKLNYGCDCDKCAYVKGLTYRDEKGNEFYLARRKDVRCSFELMNSKKLSVVNRVFVPGRYCICFDRQVLEHYISINYGAADGYEEKAPYTKGRLFDKIN